MLLPVSEAEVSGAEVQANSERQSFQMSGANADWKLHETFGQGGHIYGFELRE